VHAFISKLVSTGSVDAAAALVLWKGKKLKDGGCSVE